MAKKHKKIFKQRIKEMLSQIERLEPKETTAPSSKVAEPVIFEKPVENEKLPESHPSPITPSVLSLTPISIVKSDLKKIALLLSAMFLVIITASIIASKTNWFFILADKLYNWAQLGS